MKTLSIASVITSKTKSEYICPRDQSSLYRSGDALECLECRTVFPIVKGIPVLIDDTQSVFRVADYVDSKSYDGANYGSAMDKSSGMRRTYRRLISWIKDTGVDIKTSDSGDALRRALAENPSGRILVIGSGSIAPYNHPNVIYTDVAFGSLAKCICDAHSLPFPNGYFSCVIAIAVLEHVADPQRCVAEMHRVLCDDGLVFAETPFLQPVHMGAYDFTRFTHLGHRRLFRYFTEIDSGGARGPSAAIGFMIPPILMCLSNARIWHKLAKLAGVLISAPVRQMDRIIGKKRASLDCAGAVYFYGSRADTPISDRDLIGMYRGG